MRGERLWPRVVTFWMSPALSVFLQSVPPFCAAPRTQSRKTFLERCRRHRIQATNHMERNCHHGHPRKIEDKRFLVESTHSERLGYAPPGRINRNKEKPVCGSRSVRLQMLMVIILMMWWWQSWNSLLKWKWPAVCPAVCPACDNRKPRCSADTSHLKSLT